MVIYITDKNINIGEKQKFDILKRGMKPTYILRKPRVMLNLDQGCFQMEMHERLRIKLVSLLPL